MRRRSLSDEHFPLVPCEEISVRSPRLMSWNSDCRSTQRIVSATVSVFFARTFANAKHIVGSDGDIASVIEPMEISPKEQAIVHSMLAAAAVRHDVGGVEDRTRVLLGYGTAPS